MEKRGGRVNLIHLTSFKILSNILHNTLNNNNRAAIMLPQLEPVVPAASLKLACHFRNNRSCKHKHNSHTTLSFIFLCKDSLSRLRSLEWLTALLLGDELFQNDCYLIFIDGP